MSFPVPSREVASVRVIVISLSNDSARRLAARCTKKRKEDFVKMFKSAKTDAVASSSSSTSKNGANGVRDTGNKSALDSSGVSFIERKSASSET